MQWWAFTHKVRTRSTTTAIYHISKKTLLRASRRISTPVRMPLLGWRRGLQQALWPRRRGLSDAAAHPQSTAVDGIASYADYVKPFTTCACSR
jgi:hypothetical protein